MRRCALRGGDPGQVLSEDRAGVERDCGPTAASVCIGSVGAACFDLFAVGPQSRSLADAGFSDRTEVSSDGCDARYDHRGYGKHGNDD
jgi:hypothetical protein